MDEPRKKTIPEIMLERAELVRKYHAIERFKNRTNSAIKPVVYMKLKSEDPLLYVVGTARCARRIPGFKSHEDDNYADGMSYTMLPDQFMSEEDLRLLGEKLTKELTPYKALPNSGEPAYALSSTKVWQWLDFIAAWHALEINADPNSEHFNGLAQKAAKLLYRARNGETYAKDDDTPPPLDVNQPINEKAAAAEKEKREEMKKIAEFAKERVVQLDQNQSRDTPPLPKDDIVSMYRIWARGAVGQSSARIVEYMQTTFSAQPVYTSASDNTLAFKGFALKTDDWVYAAPDDNQAPTAFLRDKCTFSFKARSHSRTILSAYLEWYSESDYPKTKLPPELKRNMRTALEKCSIVLPAVVDVNGVLTIGWHGVALRGDANSAASSPSEKPTVLRAAVIVERRVPGPGGALLGSWPSIAKASTFLKIGVSKLRSMVAQQTPDTEGAILVFAKKSPDSAGTSASASTM